LGFVRCYPKCHGFKETTLSHNELNTLFALQIQTILTKAYLKVWGWGLGVGAGGGPGWGCGFVSITNTSPKVVVAIPVKISFSI
jgi:hypothetical protein